MRLLLDECVPKRLGREFIGHEVRTVPEQGWIGTKNGRLLALAAAEFDVFITVDQGISFQQNLVSLEIAIVAMSAPSNTLDDLLPLIPAVLDAIGRAKPGTFVLVP